MSSSQASTAALKLFQIGKASSLRSLIQNHLNSSAAVPIAAANLIGTVSDSHPLRRRFETPIPKQQVFALQSNAAIALGNQIGLAGAQKPGLFARGRPVKIDDEVNEDDADEFDEDSDEFESEDDDDDEFDDVDDIIDDDDEDEVPVYRKRK